MELKWRQSTTTFGGPHILCCKNGLSLSIAYCSLFSLCLFPLLDRERSKRVSKEWQLQKKLILWDTRKSSRQTDTSGAADGSGAQRSMSCPISSAVVAQWWSGWGKWQTARQRTAQANQWTASQAERRAGKATVFFTLTPRLSFHLENGVFKKWTEKLERWQALEGRTVFKCVSTFWPQQISLYIYLKKFFIPFKNSLLCFSAPVW